ncbi:hypothetical protein [Anaeroselena agilis]|uniref:ECF transporter S component n=1 Tax=Anaeroselena agilis TaxID=3063788 RepID=A0ABU3NV29_9FIRM|nr:hypothetical protein [Selenomonadales bacterium 4137-cl]
MTPSRPDLLARAALLLALTVIFQSLRLIIPVPPFFTTFIIGSLVNACLLIACETVGLAAAALLAAVTPVVAYLQGLLFLPVFIPPVALAHLLYALIYKTLLARGRFAAIGAATVIKTAVLFAAFTWLLTFINVPPKLAAGIMFVMGWPQIFTGIMGGVLAAIVVKRVGGRP